MILIEDTRQKHGKHDNVRLYCESREIEIYPLTLTVGDYMLGQRVGGTVTPLGNIACDSKADLIELAKDLSNDEKALNKKYRKCFEQGIKLIVLIEQPFDTTYDIIKWQNRYSNVNGRTLLDKMQRLELMYGIEFMFCDKKHTGETIIKILNNYG